MQDLTFRKETFDLSDSLRYELSIQASLDGFLFVIKDSGRIICFSRQGFSYPNENLLLRRIREIYDEQGFPGHSFLKTEIFMSGPDFSLIPQPLFSGKLASRILAGDAKTTPGSEILCMPLENMDATLIFSGSPVLLSFFRENHPGCMIGHEVSLLLRNFARSGSPALFIHVHATWFYAISFNDKGLNFLNTFQYQTPEDFLYYLLSVVALPEVEGLPVYFSGDVDGEHPCFNLARKHLPHAEIFRNLPGSELPGGGSEIPVQLLPGITHL